MVQNAFGQPQSVVVLGGTSDIAEAIVLRLVAARTRTVVLAGRDAHRLDLAAAGAASRGASTTATVTFDAVDSDRAGDVVAACFEAAQGPVDLVLVALGDLGHQEEDEDSAVDVARRVAVNFSWPAAALAEVRRRLVAQGSGTIVVLSSVAAIRVRRNNYVYSGAKAGLDQMCAGIADSLRGTGASLLLVRPGFVHSKMTAGRAAAPFAVDPEDVAGDVLGALGRGQSVVYSPGVLRWVFLVLRHLPAPLWRKVMARQ
jgi:decaprenylphospho-beta-D-erythro-pentofuranosid-2-ulose 2-reductase